VKNKKSKGCLHLQVVADFLQWIFNSDAKLIRTESAHCVMTKQYI